MRRARPRFNLSGLGKRALKPSSRDLLRMEGHEVLEITGSMELLKLVLQHSGLRIKPGVHFGSDVESGTSLALQREDLNAVIRPYVFGLETNQILDVTHTNLEAPCWSLYVVMQSPGDTPTAALVSCKASESSCVSVLG